MTGRRKALVLAPALILALLFFTAERRLGAAPLSLELSASLDELVSCLGGEVEVSFVVRNPDPQTMPVGGFQAFLRFPAELFDLVDYRQVDLKGSAVVNAPQRFGAGYLGYEGCDAPAADDWDDGRGADVVSIIASGYAQEGSSGPVKAGVATLGAFRFRLRSGVTAQKDAASFALEFDSCSSQLQQGPAIFDDRGRMLEVGFPRSQVSLKVLGVAVRNLACAANPSGRGAVLTWDPPQEGQFDGVKIYRNSEVVRPLVPPSERSITDEDAPAGMVTYEVVAFSGGVEQTCRPSCTIDLGSAPGVFVRGDANGDRRFNITDPLVILNSLYFGGILSCEDAADVDDTGNLDLTDVVALLDHLFQGGAQPEPPYPAPGTDPTTDLLGCGA
jgi:hypothetical protein